MATLEEKIVNWIRAAKYDQNASKGKDLIRLDLIHYGASREETLWSRDELTKTSEERELAIAIEDNAQRDANSLGGTQSYGLRAHYDGIKKGGYPFRFKILAETDDALQGRDLDSEPATEKGVTKMMMRHTEAAFKMTIGASGGMMAFLEKQCERLQKRIDELETRNTEVMKMYETLMGAQHDREMEAIKFQKREERIDEVVTIVKAIGPGVVNRVAGAEVFPGAKDPAILEIQAFMATLKPEQLAKIGMQLEGPQQAALMNLVNNNLKLTEGAKKL